MSKNIPSIHVSDIRLFKSCRRKWNWNSPIKNNLESKRPTPHFLVGTLFHQVFELEKRDGTPWQVSFDKLAQTALDGYAKDFNLWQAEVAQTAIEVGKIKDVISNYYSYYSSYVGEFSDNEFEFLALEREWDLPIIFNGKVFRSARLAGRIDGVVRHKAEFTESKVDEYYLWENKTTASPSNLINSLFNDEQAGIYLWAAQQLFNLKISGVLYNIVKKDKPDVPKVLQDGTLSKAKSINTTYTAYLLAIKQQHPEWTLDKVKKQYGDILAYLDAKPQDFFTRVLITRSPIEIEQLMINTYYVINEMIDNKTALYPAPSGITCNYCAFRDPCEARNKGNEARVKLLLDSEFKIKTGYLETVL